MFMCPKFNECACNVCPLDPDMLAMGALRGEEQCRTRRATREALAAQYGPELLPTGGRTHAEVRKDRRRAAWLALPSEVRELRLARLSAGRADAKTIVKSVASKKTPPQPGVVLPGAGCQFENPH